MVAERDHVRAGGEQPLRELRRDPDSVGDVLAVEDAEGDIELFAQARQPFLDRAAARRADDVSDEEDLQRSERVAAGRTSSETLLPASWV